MTNWPVTAAGLSRRGFLAAGGAIAGASLLGACRGSTGSSAGGSRIRVWTFLSADGTSPREVVLKDLINKFQQANPDFEVVVEAQPFEELESKFITASQRGAAPDVIWARDTFLYLLEDANSLLNLDEHLSSDFKSATVPDMFKVFTDKAVFDGNRLALPLWPTPAQVLFYRDDVLKAVGHDRPPLEWSAFSDAVAGLTAGSRYGLGLPMNDSGVTPFLMLLNGFSDETFDPKTGRFDLLGDEAKTVAETLRALAQRKAVPKDVTTATGQDIQDQFSSGRYAVAMAFGPRFSAYKESAAGYKPETLKVSAWPSFGRNAPSALLGPYWNVGVSAKSANPDAAVAFVEFLYSTEASLAWAKTAGQVPDRRSVLQDPFFSSDANGKTIADLATIIEADGARVLPQRLQDVTALANVLNKSVQRLIGTNDDVSAILASTKAELKW